MIISNFALHNFRSLINLNSEACMYDVYTYKDINKFQNELSPIFSRTYSKTQFKVLCVIKNKFLSNWIIIVYLVIVVSKLKDE